MTSPALAAERESTNTAKQAVGFSAGWITGSGVTYRHYKDDSYIEGTLFGLVSGSAKDTYVNIACSLGHYLHRVPAQGKVPPIGLKLLGGMDLVWDRRSNENDKFDMSYYGAGVALDFGNPGKAGLTVSIAYNYVFAFNGISSAEFEWFGTRPAASLIYGW